MRRYRSCDHLIPVSHFPLLVLWTQASAVGYPSNSLASCWLSYTNTTHFTFQGKSHKTLHLCFVRWQTLGLSTSFCRLSYYHLPSVSRVEFWSPFLLVIYWCKSCVVLLNMLQFVGPYFHFENQTDTSAPAAGHFGPIASVPKCIGAELSQCRSL